MAYQYRFHYEYGLGGSWDEHSLWRIPGQGQALLTRALDDSANLEDRWSAITQALRHPKHQVLADHVSTVGGRRYRDLLSLVHSGGPVWVRTPRAGASARGWPVAGTRRKRG